MLHLEVQQNELAADARLPDALIKKTAQAVAAEYDTERDVTISVVFVSEDEIRRLNKRYREKDEVTDVLSFPLEPANGGRGNGSPTVGEVVICRAQAARQAERVGHATQDEVVFLLVHGILHVFGYDHMNAADKREMFALQDRILKHLNIESNLETYD